MLEWNPIPFTGYIDANNHFLNSFLGGLFVRLFQSEAIWICRLPNVLAFPVFYWSIVSFKSYFNQKSAYYFLVISLACTVFLLDFFSLARGYGLAWAFLMLALVSTNHYYLERSPKSIYIALLAWLTCIYANLSLVTVSFIGMLLLQVLAIQKKQKKHSILTAFSTLGVFAGVYYAFFLQEKGKLYLGNETDFLETTVHDLSVLMYSRESIFIDVFLIGVFLISTIQLLRYLISARFLFQPQQLFAFFLFTSVLAIFLQNWLFSVNFPEDRSAGFLVIFFYGSLSFLLDRSKLKWVAHAFSGVLLIAFVFQANLTHTRTYYYEHFDKELISLIPEYTEGIPSSTGARFWTMDNELTKQEGYPIRTFQPSGFREDTLTDYIIQRPRLRPFIEDTYDKIHEDKISGLALYQRKSFLGRSKVFDFERSFDSNGRYINFVSEGTKFPCFVRVTGTVKDLTMHDNFNIILVAQDSVSGEDGFFQLLNPVAHRYVEKDKELAFDYTITVKDIDEINQVEVFIQNIRNIQLAGNFRVRIYQVE